MITHSLSWEPFEGDRRTGHVGLVRRLPVRVAAGLVARGVKVGDRVLVHLNRPESIFSWFGCSVAGASAVTTNARSVRRRVELLRGQCPGCRRIHRNPRFADPRPASTKPGFLIVTETDNGALPAPGTAPDAADSFERLFEGQPMDLRTPDPHLNFSVQFTSGTTSCPRCAWNHANALWGARMCARNGHLTRATNHLTHLPLFHTNAQAYSVLSSLWAGGTVVAQPRFSASDSGTFHCAIDVPGRRSCPSAPRHSWP